jgi:hypothetical protein
MISVVITGPPKTGFLPYRVDWWFYGRPQLIGASPVPLLDACRQLKQMGLMDSTDVGLFDNLRLIRLTTVGAGDREFWRAHAMDTPKTEGIKGTPDMNVMPPMGDNEPSDEPLTTRRTHPQATGEPTTKSAEAEHHPHKSPKRPAGKGRAQAKRDRSEPQRHKQKSKGSGGRRGSR